jgi:methyltransferase (TIGR00027 family)
MKGGIRMKEKGASMTARWVAMMRGMHLVVDDNPKIFTDQFGQALADLPDAEIGGINDPNWVDPEKTGNRTHMIWRSRITEDHLQGQALQGISQYVLLGAGLDSFAYRRPASLEHISVFEIDHPSSQEWKRQRLKELDITIPENVYFVPVDFETEDLIEKLKQSKFDPALPSFFSWLGVIYYLNKEATQKTLRTLLATISEHCEFVLDFMIPTEMLSGRDRTAMEETIKTVTDAGEPFLGLYSPEELEATLKQVGFDKVTHISPEDGQKRFFDNRTDTLRLSTALHMMIASREKL